MNIVIGPETQKLLEEQMKKGGYQDADDAVRAGLLYLEQQENAGHFAPGELDNLLAVADADVERGEVLEGGKVFRELRELGTTLVENTTLRVHLRSPTGGTLIPARRHGGFPNGQGRKTFLGVENRRYEHSCEEYA